jgi:hypothetical protein
VSTSHRFFLALFASLVSYFVGAQQPQPKAPLAEAGQRPLLGGWRLACPFAAGGIAIDFDTNSLWLVGNGQVFEFTLPEVGKGRDIESWPILRPNRAISRWWQDGCYAHSLCWWKGKLWASPRHPYDTAPPPTLELSTSDGEKLVVKAGRQAFSGFVKRGPNQEPYVGAGGHESGQGSSKGPTLATLQGQILIYHDVRDGWNGREKREPNYHSITGKDEWYCFNPRMVNNVLEGRWANDHVFGGGLVLPEGICFWPSMGIGTIAYAPQVPGSGQTTNFAYDDSPKWNWNYLYRYDPKTYKLLDHSLWSKTGAISGQELDAQGRIYLAERNAWKSELYTVDPVVRVYGSNPGK